MISSLDSVSNQGRADSLGEYAVSPMGKMYIRRMEIQNKGKKIVIICDSSIFACA